MSLKHHVAGLSDSSSESFNNQVPVHMSAESPVTVWRYKTPRRSATTVQARKGVALKLTLGTTPASIQYVS